MIATILCDGLLIFCPMEAKKEKKNTHVAIVDPKKNKNMGNVSNQMCQFSNVSNTVFLGSFNTNHIICRIL